MLVRTPMFKATESLPGYVLRLSETNGYDTPWQVLSLAGISRRQALSTNFPLDRLTILLNRPPKSLGQIAYSSHCSAASIEYKLLNHPLGHHLRKNTFRLDAPAFCPQCVSEQGFIEAHWDVKLIDVCPRHTSALLTHCPSCKKTVSWFRPGLLECQCGMKWKGSTPTCATPSSVALTELLSLKILGELDEVPNHQGFPTEFTQLSIKSLLVLTRILGEIAMYHIRGDEKPVSAAAHVLSNWPHHYEEFLTQLNKGEQCHNLIKALNRSLLPTQELEFLRRPLLALRPAKPAVSLPTRTSKVIKRRTSIKQLSGRTSLGDRSAATWLGLPVSVLNALRASGHFKVRNVATPRSAYHRVDLENFKKEIVDRITFIATSSSSPVEAIALGDVLRNWKFRNPEGKRDLMIALMTGTMVTLGRTGHDIGDTLLSKRDVTDIQTEAKNQIIDMGRSAYATSNQLDCDRETIQGLVDQGYLLQVKTITGLRIKAQSVDEFRMRFASMASIAKKCGTSSRHLTNICAELAMPLLFISRGRRKGKQPFIGRNYVKTISDAINARS